VNSADLITLGLVRSDNRQKRDRFDRDGRVTKDFLDVNLDVANFSSKFAPGAISVIWGCDVFSFWRIAIRQAIAKSKGTSTPSFRIEFSTDMQLGLTDFHTFLGGSGNFSDLFTTAEFASRVRSKGIEFTYMKGLARASGNLVIGALPGTSGNYDEKPPKGSTLKSLQLMHVPQGRREDAGSLTDVMRFYKDKLTIRFELSTKLKLNDDPGDFDRNFGRGYGSFDP